jgi:hemerythrin
MGNKIEIVKWSDVYVTGLAKVDAQHKDLIDLTNELYQACMYGDDVLGIMFKEVMSRMVEYVRLHFTTEMGILTKIKFPNIVEHKKQHDELVKNILNAAKEYEAGKKYAANNFARVLKEWILSHIAIYDKEFALYFADQKNKGLLSDQHLES